MNYPSNLYTAIKVKMKRYLIIIFLILTSACAFGQTGANVSSNQSNNYIPLKEIEPDLILLQNRLFFWYLPSSNTRIDGIAGGLIINDLKNSSPVSKTIVNGISIELIGLGIILPLTSSHPLYKKDESFYQNIKNVDSLVNSYRLAKYCINGISLSSAGIAGLDVKINGLNLSGLNTLAAMTNGLSASILININGVVNGISIGGLINNTIQTKGLQIGMFNKTKRLRGIQIGLWNVNEKRKLPIINWNFK